MYRLIKRLGFATAPRFSALIAFLVVFCALMYRLRSLTLDKSLAVEQLNIQRAGTWHGVWHNLFNAPYFAILRILEYVSGSVIMGRLLSIAFGLLAAALVYYIVFKWLGWKFAALSVVLFGTNSYTLHTARLADPYVLQLFAGLSLLALFCAIYKQQTARSLLLWSLVVPSLLYIPGTGWLVLVALLFSYRKLGSAWHEASKKLRAFSSALMAIVLAPLVYFIVINTVNATNFSILRLWLGIDNRISATIYLKRLTELPLHLFWHADSAKPIVSAANLSALGLAIGILALLGLYVAMGRLYDQRWRLIVGLLIGSWLVTGLGTMDAALLLPLLYILAVVGLAYLLNEWYKVFPRNPLARSIGFGLILAVVLLSCTYNLRAYFVAWAHSPTTARQFSCPVNQRRPASCTADVFDIQ